ncbi:MAG TPA: MaoC family dehydratase N-terminal domain-containing protein [Dehalococcoidia bacterium]|nr:MaoC family dehydratase N-terminal domain-containing protein [Dehalococcoidia bacterium]
MVMELEYDRSLYGKEHEAGPFEVTREMIQAFSRSIGETGAVFNDEAAAQAAGYRSVVAPPTLCTLYVRRVELPDINLKFGRTRFHAGQRVQARAPILAGDFLTASSHLKEVYPKTGRSGTMVFIVWETTFRNQKGEVVAEVQESYAARE